MLTDIEDKIYRYSDDFIPRENHEQGLLSDLILSCTELLDETKVTDEVLYYQLNEMHTSVCNFQTISYRVDEYYIEDTPIYGNLDNMVPEPMDENCYEQMKAHPERSVNKLQKAAPAAQAAAEAQTCYASLNHSYKGKCRQPRKQNTHLSDKVEDEQLHAMESSISKTTLVDSFPPESQAIEENIHDDPIRLFGLIRAKREPVN